MWKQITEGAGFLYGWLLLLVGAIAPGPKSIDPMDEEA